MAVNQRNYLIIDACILINLYATEIIQEILEVIAQNSVICILVKEESFYLRREEDINEVELINVEDLINQGVIQICDFDNVDEQNLFVNLAVELDDGEAMSIAIALSRNWHFATDDKKARKIFNENSQRESLLVSTTDLIKEWAEIKKPDNTTLKAVLLKIERKASFYPPKSDLNLQWWNNIISTE